MFITAVQALEISSNARKIGPIPFSQEEFDKFVSDWEGELLGAVRRGEGAHTLVTPFGPDEDIQDMIMAHYWERGFRVTRMDIESMNYPFLTFTLYWT